MEGVHDIQVWNLNVLGVQRLDGTTTAFENDVHGPAYFKDLSTGYRDRARSN